MYKNKKYGFLLIDSLLSFFTISIIFSSILLFYTNSISTINFLEDKLIKKINIHNEKIIYEKE